MTRAGTGIVLQPREFRLLEFLMRHAGQTVTRTMLLEGVWKYRFEPETKIIDVQMSRLRQKIDRGSILRSSIRCAAPDIASVRISLCHTTTFRLMAFASLAFIAVGGAVLGFLYWSMLSVIDAQIGGALSREASDMTAAYEKGGYERLRQTVADRASPHEDTARLYLLIGPDGAHTGNLKEWPAHAPGPGGTADIEVQSCTRTNSMSVMFRPVSSLISRRSAVSDVSPRLILPPGMPHLPDHLCVRIISTSFLALKISAPTVASGGSTLPPVPTGWRWNLFFNSTRLNSAEMLHDQVRLGGAQLLQRVVAGQHGAGMDAAVPRGLDVVLHVADEQRFVRLRLFSRSISWIFSRLSQTSV